MRVLVNKKEIIELQKKLFHQTDELYSEIEFLEKLKESFIWQGKAYRSFIAKYDDNIRMLKKRIDMLLIYIKFLDAFIKNDSEAMEEIKYAYDKLKEEDGDING